MDVTSLFKACVKTARLKNKGLAVEKPKTIGLEKKLTNGSALPNFSGA